jgi:16S rRNA processing protein RimM
MDSPTPNFPDYYELGTVIRTHGIKGDVVIYLDTDEPGRYKKTKSVWLDLKGNLQEFQVTKASITEKLGIFHLAGLDDINVSENYIKVKVYMPLSGLPKLKGKQFYFHEIIGFTVQDETEGLIGPLIDVYELTQHPVGEALWNEQKILFPLVAEFITGIDREEKILHMKLPEGMLDVYR